jgi:hypothetical protein
MFTSICMYILIYMRAHKYININYLPAYQEVIVKAYPYGSEISVQAIVLRANISNKLLLDTPPSTRYMEIIIKGAIELNLDNEYIEFLKSIPCAPIPPMYLHFLAEKNMNFVGFLFKNNYLRILFGWSTLLHVFHYRDSKVCICI